MRLARIGIAVIGPFVLALAGLCRPAAGQEKAQPAAPQVVVLDGRSFWRLHQTLGPPVVQLDGGLKQVLVKQYWLNWRTPEPPPAWRTPGFDDGGWVRLPALRAAKTPYLARLCLRGRFTVGDPAKAGKLTLSLGYHGGASVTVNGKEIARRHMSGRGANALAEPYPLETYVGPDGKLMHYRRASAEARRRMAMRVRRCELTIPPAGLRKGVNVLAIEIVRAPCHKVIEEKTSSGENRGKPSPYDVNWNTCEVRSVRLAAAGGAGVSVESVRPAGLQVWNSNMLAADFDLDFAGPSEPLRPVRMVAARNAACSGKVVVGCDKPLRKLRASMSDLTAAGRRIPASAVRVRYALPWGWQHVVGRTFGGRTSPYRAAPAFLSALVDPPPTDVPGKATAPGRRRNDPPRPLDAVMPVWMTVKVPADAGPGTYTGKLTIRAEGAQAITVPVELKVIDWVMPAPDRWRTWVELMQSPDTLAMEYGKELWSNEHFELIGKSFDYFKEVGSGVVYVPLIAESNLGNAESMVRWIDKSNGRWDHDFSVMDRYLDVVLKHMGRPKFVVFPVWDVYIIPDERFAKATHAEANAMKYLREHKNLLGAGPAVTVVDPATGKTEKLHLPHYTGRRCKAMWKPLFERLRQRMKRLGLADRMLLGMMSDARPTSEEIAFLNDVSGKLPWMVHSHHGAGAEVRGARIAYQARVWNISFGDYDPARGRIYGWRKATLMACYERRGTLNSFPHTHWRNAAEICITGSTRGLARIGGDFWPILKNRDGRRAITLGHRYPHSSWRNLNLYSSVLAPGPDGPVATSRFEVFREGVQDCETRICLERLLADKGHRGRLGADLAGRCQAALDERLRYIMVGLANLQLTGARWQYTQRWHDSPGVAGHLWYIGSGWQVRSEKLLRLAAEAARKLGAKSGKPGQ